MTPDFATGQSSFWIALMKYYNKAVIPGEIPMRTGWDPMAIGNESRLYTRRSPAINYNLSDPLDLKPTKGSMLATRLKEESSMCLDH